MGEDEQIIDPFSALDDLSDVTLIVEDKKIFAHKSILVKNKSYFSHLLNRRKQSFLAKISPVFSRMLYSHGFRESQTNEIIFPGKQYLHIIELFKYKKLPKLKYFSLTVPSFTCYYDIQIVLLLCRMINLEELKLYLSVTRFNSTYVDGKFTFCINTEVFNEKVRVELSSNEDIQRSFIGRGYQQVTSYVDTNSMKTEGYCFLYSVPYDFEDFVQHNNSYQGGMFQKVRQLTMYNKIPFELFKLISEDFPFLQFLYISNGHPQQDKSHSSTLITFPYLTFLNLKYAHVDYAELFLLKNNVHLPRLLDLRIEYQ
ncbi:unnamed protein product [Rotaria socialis]|uniref:BTB domain-containing protein n=1 Tax=Rotaria socialis TaxID=392032 RepID=A0A817Q1Y7_9BILA|nr:unnamed protein product [Rotaria socialis]CAF4500812.1 unnamed protein product [Rotaria socialis]CAF4559042.1 unnamed protein product [Rotaria socialis]CAF4586042.1 unnamed protein product [Rotaria socialis]CAF4610530.1 unnamed protein product [Rotaria socialis]